MENFRKVHHRFQSQHFFSKLTLISIPPPPPSLPPLHQGDVLEWEYVKPILISATKLFQVEPNIVRLTVYPGSNFTVCGDLHGQLPDLLTIFRIRCVVYSHYCCFIVSFSNSFLSFIILFSFNRGLPSENNCYLFNGDVVDRGSHGVECLLLIMIFKIAFPRSVFVNRGNHETKFVCSFVQVCCRRPLTIFIPQFSFFFFFLDI